MEIVTDDLMSKKGKSFVNILNDKIDTHEEIAYKHLIKADALRMKNYFWESIDEYLVVLKFTSEAEIEQNQIKNEEGLNSSFIAMSLDANKGLGYAYKQIGYTQSAISSFNKAKKLSPFDKTLYYEIGCCYCMDKKYDKAIKELKKAMKICPEYIEAQ